MAFVLKDRVRETTTTNGTGAITPSGVVTGGYQTFNAVLSNGDTTLCLVRNDAGEWQTFLGTWNSGTQAMARTTAYEGSSGAGVNVGFSGTAQEIWIDYPAEKFQNPSFRKLHVGTNYSTLTGFRKFGVNHSSVLSGAPATTNTAIIVTGTLSGNLTGAQTGYLAQNIDSDTLTFSDTGDGITVNYYGHTMGSGWSGGRTTQQTFLSVAADGTAGPSAYHVSGAAFAYSSGDAGGVPGAERGNLFGRNDATRVQAGSGVHWNSTFGNETDVGVEADNMVLWKGGIKVVQWSTDRVRGLIQDFAYGVNNQSNTSTPGWHIGFALGGFEGYWPFRTDSTVMKKITASAGAGNAVEAAAGIDLRGITFGESSLASDGFRVDGSGNVGGLTTGGVALQTRSAINAKTAVVNTITVLEGGLFLSPVTLTLSAPTTSGTTATATVATYSMRAASGISTGGTGYALGDTFTVGGGTSSVATTGVVTKLNGSGVIGVRITNAGTNSYSTLPANPVATTTSGAGTGFTFTPFVSVLTVTVSGAGTNYSEFLPPVVTSAGNVTYRQATLKVAMTATLADLLLNASGTTRPDRILQQYTQTAAGALSSFVVANQTLNGNVSSSSNVYVNSFNVVDGANTTTGSGPGALNYFTIIDSLNSSATGGRSGLLSIMNLGGSMTNSVGNLFYNAGSFFAQSSTNQGGSAVGGNFAKLVGVAIEAKALAGATYTNSVESAEMGAGVRPGASAGTVHVLRISPEGATGSFGGLWGYNGIVFAHGTAAGNDALGLDTAIGFGGADGDAWPLARAGNLLEIQTPNGAPTNTVAWGVDFARGTFDGGAWRSPGAAISGAGNIGGAAVYGTSLQTMSAIKAANAVVGSIAVTNGGAFDAIPTLTISASPGGGTLATATVASMKGARAFIDTQGSGYTNGDVLTLSGGTFATAAQLTLTVAGGLITEITVSTAGSYTVLPTNAVSVTGGTGTGAKFYVQWGINAVTVTNGGTLYPTFPAPFIACSAEKSIKALFAVTMTETQRQLQLNNGKINVTGIPTSSAGLSAGDVYSNAGVLTVV